jgi:hypothetical protein
MNPKARFELETCEFQASISAALKNVCGLSSETARIVGMFRVIGVSREHPSKIGGHFERPGVPDDAKLVPTHFTVVDNKFNVVSHACRSTARRDERRLANAGGKIGQKLWRAIVSRVQLRPEARVGKIGPATEPGLAVSLRMVAGISGEANLGRCAYNHPGVIRGEPDTQPDG